jgi:hypothetical protein
MWSGSHPTCHLLSVRPNVPDFFSFCRLLFLFLFWSALKMFGVGSACQTQKYCSTMEKVGEKE